MTMTPPAIAASRTHDQKLTLVPQALRTVGLSDDQSIPYIDSQNALHVRRTSFTTAQADTLIRRLGPTTTVCQEDRPDAGTLATSGRTRTASSIHRDNNHDVAVLSGGESTATVG